MSSLQDAGLQKQELPHTAPASRYIFAATMQVTLHSGCLIGLWAGISIASWAVPESYGTWKRGLLICIIVLFLGFVVRTISLFMFVMGMSNLRNLSLLFLHLDSFHTWNCLQTSEWK